MARAAKPAAKAASGRARRAPENPRVRARKAKDWAPAFLKALEDTHLVSESVKVAGVGRRTAYDRRDRDPEFAQAWSEVEERSTEELEQIAVKRATDGSDLLLMFLLKARRPSVYREHHHVEHAGDVEVNVNLVTDPALREQAASLRRGLAAARPVKPGRADAGNGTHLAAAASH